MKLNYLSAAVATAIAMTLTGCGGSDDNDVSYTPATTTPAPAPTPTPTPEPTPTPTTPTPTTPTPTTPTPTPATTIDPTVIDPTGTKAAIYDNIDLATTSTVVGQSYVRNAGANFDRAANPDSAKNATSIALGSIDLDTQNPELTNIVVGYDGAKSTAGVDIKRFVGNIPNGKTNQTVTSVDLNKVVTTKDVTLQSLQTVNSNAGVQVATTGYATDTAGTTGLVSSSALSGSFNDTKTGVIGAEESNDLATRIFGKNYRDTVNTGNNSYAYTATNATADQAAALTAPLTPTELKLNNVQYGRVSSNIDALSGTQADNFVVSDYRNKQAGDAVSNYFYRGTGETSATQMAALPKDAVYTYFGHALTYGLDNTGSTSGTSNTPNSFGTGTQVDVLGNFVRADYTVATGGVAGSIYNAVKTTTNVGTPSQATAVAPVNLVTFTGTATGNTVIGTSERVSDKSAGLLRASFYGANAEELGGAVNSNTSGYGTASWGGVFGAQRQVAPVTPPVTTAPTNGWLVQSPN